MKRRWYSERDEEEAHDDFFSKKLKVFLAGDSTKISDPECNCGRSLLHHSVSKGLQEETLLLLNRGANLFSKNVFGQTPLHVAVEIKNIELVKILSERTTDINVKNHQLKTPLHLAVLNGCTEGVRILLEHGADAKVPDYTGNTPLHYAFQRYLNVVEILVDHVLDVDVRNHEGETPLHVAVIHVDMGNVGRVEAIQILIDKGAKINLQDHAGQTPLHILAKTTFPDLCTLTYVTLLLNHGASIVPKCREGWTPLHVAIHYGLSVESVKLMIESTTDKSVFNIPNNFGDHPLHTAVRRRNLELVKLILDNGALINKKNKKGETALHVDLMISLSYKIYKLLIDRGAKVNARDKNMRTLHNAASRKFLDHAISYLLAKGANPNSRDKNGFTPLHCAVKCVRLNPVVILLNNGADVNSENANGETPLMNVECNADILEFLLERGAKVNVTDKFGRTVLHHTALNYIAPPDENVLVRCYLRVRMSTAHERVDTLLDWGACLSVKDHFGKTPFEYNNIKGAKDRNNTKKECLKPQHTVKTELPFEKDCCAEIAKMKELRFGNHTLFDVFGQYHDPKFLWNKELESAVKSTCLKKDVPLYHSLLKSTYKKAENRVELLKAAADIIQSPLPIEVLRYILTFVDDNSLYNVVKAKGELVIHSFVNYLKVK